MSRSWWRHALIILGYTALFWVVLPAGLWRAGRWVDAVADWRARPWPGGVVIALSGAALMGWAMVALHRHGRGLPISALPPPRLVRTGPFALVRHPIYASFALVVFGAGLALGAPGLAWIVAPSLLPILAAYAAVEERTLRARFGGAYTRYRAAVGFLLPRVRLYPVVRALTRGLLPVRVEGAGRVPAEGPVIVLANHACYLDPCFVALATRRHIHFAATAQAWRGPFGRWFLARCGAIPVRRYRPDPVACREVVRRLADGEVVGLFPEGERSVDGAFHGAQRDVARIVARLGVPTVAVGVSGAYDFGPRWADVLRRRPVAVRVGASIAWGLDPARSIDAALRALVDPDPQPVHLAGLPAARLARVLWACPECGEGEGWRAEDLRCACGAAYDATADGWLRDRTGRVWSMAELASRLAARPLPARLAATAVGWRERSLVGRPRRLVRLGGGTLEVHPGGVRFRDLDLPATALRSVSTEGSDLLQVTTADGMWQFALPVASVFRFHDALERWSAQAREEARRGGVSARRRA